MNREIKFRAWIEKHKDMAVQGTPDIETLQSFMFHYGDEPILMQFTGLKDKNRKDVFEGDIVRLTNTAYGSNTGIVKYFMHGNPSFQAEEINEDFPSTFHLQIKAKEIEVIGNIYENPELKTGF
jgi:uncharacterized phage protein (TIGR01671 family)